MFAFNFILDPMATAWVLWWNLLALYSASSHPAAPAIDAVGWVCYSVSVDQILLNADDET